MLTYNFGMILCNNATLVNLVTLNYYDSDSLFDPLTSLEIKAKTKRIEKPNIFTRTIRWEYDQRSNDKHRL